MTFLKSQTFSTLDSMPLNRRCVISPSGLAGHCRQLCIVQVTSHYRSGLQLLTSSASHGHAHSQGAGESAVVERMVRKLVRAGR